MEPDWNEVFGDGRDARELGHRCAECDTDHQGLPDLAFQFPDDVFAVPASDRERRVQHSSDLCVLDGERHFLRAILPMAIDGTDAEYCFGLWVEISSAAFERYREIFDEDPPEGEGPFDGCIGNSIPGYDDTLGLDVRVHLLPDGKRPRLELVGDGDHALVEHQRSGVALAHLLHLLAPYIDHAPERGDDDSGDGENDEQDDHDASGAGDA